MRKDRICPHCGRLPEKKSSFQTMLSVLALFSAALALFSSGRRAQEPAAEGGGRLTDQRAAYVFSPEGAAACAPCLAAADESIKARKAAVLAERTKGMALIPAGEHLIGSPDGVGDPDEHPRHPVSLGAFYIDAREVSVSDYVSFAQKTGGNFPEWSTPDGKLNGTAGEAYKGKNVSELVAKCPDCPVVGVTPANAAAYCAWVGKRLPTEAEWEAAARAGTATAYSFGDLPVMIGEYAWYRSNSKGSPHPSGTKRPNAYGLYDMHGNVWEWTADRYGKGYYMASPHTSPPGPDKGAEHVIRGGSWDFEPDALRSANRASTDEANDDIGFRCAADKEAMERQAAATES